jgi:hypothetical protein
MMTSQTNTAEEQQNGLPFWKGALVFLISCIVIVSRRPDAVFHAQFYAEDGHVWFADAYNFGWWPAIFRTWGGYFQTLPRLAAALALLVPLLRAPLLLNLIAIGFLALPVSVMLSARSAAWGSLRFRALLAAFYLVLPNCNEISYGITNAQWPLAVCAFLLLVAPMPRGTPGRLFCFIVLILCGLTGPFCIFFLPIACFQVWQHRDRWHLVPVGIFAACCMVQSWAMLFLAPAARAHRELGATPVLFGRILGSQIYLGALLGNNGLSAAPGFWVTASLLFVAVGGTVLIAECSRKSPIAMKLFLAFSSVIFAAGLMNPFEWDHPTIPVWQVYAGVPGLRYWFLPTLAFAWALPYGWFSRFPSVKFISTALLCLMCLGVLRDWEHRPFTETHLAESIQRLDAAPAGSAVTIQEYPQGWTLTLVKHPPSH